MRRAGGTSARERNARAGCVWFLSALWTDTIFSVGSTLAHDKRGGQTLVVDSSPGAFGDDDDNDDDECIEEWPCECACVVATDLGGGETVFQCLADPSCPCDCSACDPCDMECMSCMATEWMSDGDCFCV